MNETVKQSESRIEQERKGFEGIGRGLNRMGGVAGGTIDRFYERWFATDEHLSEDWAENADWARMQAVPMRARTLLYGLAITILVLLIWAAFAELDEVSRGEGKVIPSSQLQVIQSFDGGVVEEILASEGQIVEKGALLMRIDPTRFLSSLRENRAQLLSLQAKAARLEALVQDKTLELPESLVEQSPGIADNELTLFNNNKNELRQQVSIADQQLSQRQEELREVEARLEQATRAYELASEELELTRPLLGSGAISEVEVLRLERDVSNADGERRQAIATRGRIRASIVEAQNKRQEVELNVKNGWREELSETLSKLATLSESSTGLEDKLKFTEIRAPVRGTIQRLFVNTIGGVVQPGNPVLELIPLDDQLLVEAKISPKDIAFLRPGQEAKVKFTAYDFAIYGGLEGVLEHISPDTITDERDETYYIVRVRTTKSGFDEDLTIIPGMTTQVDILTGNKTVLAYLLKPILRAKQNALSER